MQRPDSLPLCPSPKAHSNHRHSHLSISRARITGRGCDSAAVCALRRYHPSRLLVASS